jgi:hypothetical protein
MGCSALTVRRWIVATPLECRAPRWSYRPGPDATKRELEQERRQDERDAREWEQLKELAVVEANRMADEFKSKAKSKGGGGKKKAAAAMARE